MDTIFLLNAALILAAAVGAMALRNVVHCALCAAVAFGGLAVAFLRLQAEFAGFAQLLVYVGAVAILVAMVLLVTRNLEPATGSLAFKPWTLGVGIAALAAGTLVSAILGSSRAWRAPGPAPDASVSAVKAIGDVMMTRYIVALEVLGLLLTAALIGAVIIALEHQASRKPGA